MKRAVTGLFSVMLAVVLISFISAKKAPAVPNVIFDAANHVTDIVIPKEASKLELPRTTPPPPPQHLKTTAFTDPVITDDPVPDEKLMSKNENLNHAIAGVSSAEGIDSVDQGLRPDPVRKGGGVIPVEPVSDVPRRFVEQMPLFTGDLSAYISGHLHYPDAARSAGIQGRVLVEFVVNEDGSVSNARIVEGIGGGCDEEARNMVSNMPKWKAGKQNGSPVKVYFTIPIKFELN